jgi:hypothetical protein
MCKELPDALTELYLDVNGEGLCVDEDEDFDPICDIGWDVFRSRRRLHTCDIHAWISNVDGGLGQYPEKAVFYRQLPYDTAYKKSYSPSHLLRALWISRMDCVYQEHFSIVTVEYQSLQLDNDEDDFKGKDTDEAWCDGYEYAWDYAQQGTGRGHQVDRPDYSWPFWKIIVGSYPMFR